MKRTATWAMVISLGFALGPLIACATAQNVVLCPQAPDVLYDTMILVLQELDYTVKYTDRTSRVIQAERLSSREVMSVALARGWKMPMGSMPYQVLIEFSAEHKGSKYRISVSQPGFVLYSRVPKELMEEIQQAFEEKIRYHFQTGSGPTSSSDNVYLCRNLVTRAPITTFEPADAAANAKALDRMVSLAGAPERVVPGHDPLIFKRDPRRGRIAKVK